jgi:dihydrofolate reductase
MENSSTTISLIAAIGAGNRALGKDGQLLWQIPDDLKRFKAITSGHPVIMGRKTWESLPEKFRPLPGRLNIVVTRQEGYEATGAEVCASLETALAMAQGTHAAEGGMEVFVIGGGELYKEALPSRTSCTSPSSMKKKKAMSFFQNTNKPLRKYFLKNLVNTMVSAIAGLTSLVNYYKNSAPCHFRDTGLCISSAKENQAARASSWM